MRSPIPLSRDAKIISLVCLPHMMSHAYWLVMPPMFAVLKPAFGLTGDLATTKIAAIYSLFALSTFVFQTPVGFIVDRFGARSLLIIGLTIEATAIGLIGVSTEYWHLMVLAIFGGIGHTVYHPADYSILSTKVSEERMGRAFSIHSATGYIGFVISPIFMTEITALWHWRAAFILMGVLGLLVVLLLVTQSDALRDEGPIPIVKKRTPNSVADTMSTRDGLRLLMTLPILMCFLYFVLHQMGGGGVRGFLAVALNDLFGTSITDAGRGLAAFTAGSVLGILCGGWIADKFGARTLTAALTLLPSAFIVAILGWINLSLFELIVLLALAGFLMGSLIPSRDILLRSITPPGSMGKVMGFASTGSNLGGFIIPVLLGLVMDKVGAQWIFAISAFFIAAAFLTFITARKKYG